MREQFITYIETQLRSLHGEYIDLNAGAIHRAVGGYPGTNHRMPVCCECMYQLMRGTDTVLTAPPSGKGASLTIRYFKANH